MHLLLNALLQNHDVSDGPLPVMMGFRECGLLKVAFMHDLPDVAPSNGGLLANVSLSRLIEGNSIDFTYAEFQEFRVCSPELIV